MATDRNGEPLGLLLELEIIRGLAFDLLIICPVSPALFQYLKIYSLLFSLDSGFVPPSTRTFPFVVELWKQC